MTPKNSYVTLNNFKEYVRSRGGEIQDDVMDDVVIENLLEAASRYIDSETSRHFYPLIETTTYDTPGDSELWFDKDVQEIVSLTNGDATSISASTYTLMPKNETPKFGLKLKGSSSVSWEADSNGETEGVISLSSINGYHGLYSEAWEAATTLTEALDTSELGFDLTSGALFFAGQIIRVGNEINTVESRATNTINVVKRGDNGSTPAIASIGATVSIWRPMMDCYNACLEISLAAYHRRFGGGNENGTVSSTAEILTRDVPKLAQDFIKKYGRIV